MRILLCRRYFQIEHTLPCGGELTLTIINGFHILLGEGCTIFGILWDQLSWYIVGRLVHLGRLLLLLIEFGQCYIIATPPCSFGCIGDSVAPVL